MIKSDSNRTLPILSEEEEQQEEEEEKQWDHCQKNSASVPRATLRPQEFAISKAAVASSSPAPRLAPPSHAFRPPTTTTTTLNNKNNNTNLFSLLKNGFGNNNSGNGQHKLQLSAHIPKNNNILNNNDNPGEINDNTPISHNTQLNIQRVDSNFVDDNCNCCAIDNGIPKVKQRKFRKDRYSRDHYRYSKSKFATKSRVSENTAEEEVAASSSDCASEAESSASSIDQYSSSSNDSKDNNNNNRLQSRHCCHCRRVHRKSKFPRVRSAESCTATTPATIDRHFSGAMMIQQQMESMRRTRSEDDPEDRDLRINLQAHRYSGGVLGASIIDIGVKDNSSTDNSLAFHNAKFKRNSVAPSGRRSVSVAVNASTDTSKQQQQQPLSSSPPPTNEPELEPLESGCSEDEEASDEIVTINVSGLRFQTMERTLKRYPHSLLGCRGKRKNYWNAANNEYFFDRHRTSFEAILHIYQACGQVIRPESVPISLFLAEMSFYEMGAEVLENFWISEGYQKPAVDVLPANRWQRRVWRLMEHPDSSVLARVLAFVSVSVIIISIASFCLETLPELRRDHLDSSTGQREWSSPFFWIEFICCLWFSIELFVRFVSSPSKSKFMKSFLNVLDFVAVAPFFINILWVQTHQQPTAAPPSAVSSSSLSFSVLRIIRVVRVFRIFKLSRHSVGLQVLGKTFRASIQEFCLLIFFMAIACVLFSSGVYFAEQNEPDTKFTSIPASFWFVLATMTTVGYGDLVPHGVYGKVVGSCCALIGVLTLALPVPIIVANFKHFYRQECRLAQMYAQNKQLLLHPDDDGKEKEKDDEENEFTKSGENVEELITCVAEKQDHLCFVEDETAVVRKRTAEEDTSKRFKRDAQANCNITHNNNNVENNKDSSNHNVD